MKMVDYVKLRRKIREKKWDEITAEEQKILNDAISVIIEAFEPFITRMAELQNELFGLFVKGLNEL